jgi:hypothetical protein
MYWGLGSLAFSWIPYVKIALFKGLELLLKSMTGLTAFIASLPFSDSGTLVMDSFQSLLLYVALVSIVVFLKNKRFISLWICMLSILSMGISGILPRYKNTPGSYLIIYS